MRSIDFLTHIMDLPPFPKSIVDRHAPIKKKTIRGNNKPFMNLELTKAIKTKSRIRNKYNKWKSRENYLDYNKLKRNVNI